jgi:hypothetical protein
MECNSPSSRYSRLVEASARKQFVVLGGVGAAAVAFLRTMLDEPRLCYELLLSGMNQEGKLTSVTVSSLVIMNRAWFLNRRTII